MVPFVVRRSREGNHLNHTQQPRLLTAERLVHRGAALRVWIEPHLGGRAFASVRPEDVEDVMRAMAADGVGAKSIRNYIGTLSAIFRYSMHPRRRWARTNPWTHDRRASASSSRMSALASG
jgi:hypothetical protein